MQRGIVWVVDDDSSIRWVLERALAGAGLTCTTFENGAEVLEALASKTPDVLLSDIRMPGMDGLALLKQIKQRHPMLPVIIMTAHSDLDAAVSAYQQGRLIICPNRLISTKPSRWLSAPSVITRNSSSRVIFSLTAQRPISSAKRQPCRTCSVLSVGFRVLLLAC